MKIAVATNDFSTVAGHVGRCKGFLIYEIDDNNNVVSKKEVANTFTNHAAGAHNHHHGHGHDGSAYGETARKNIAEGIEYADFLICRAAGPGLVNSLAANNIRTVFTKIDSADEAVNLLISNALRQDESECEH